MKKYKLWPIDSHLDWEDLQKQMMIEVQRNAINLNPANPNLLENFTKNVMEKTNQSKKKIFILSREKRSITILRKKLNKFGHIKLLLAVFVKTTKIQLCQYYHLKPP